MSSEYQDYPIRRFLAIFIGVALLALYFVIIPIKSHAQALFSEAGENSLSILTQIDSPIQLASKSANVDRFHENFRLSLLQELEGSGWEVYDSETHVLSRVVLDSRLSDSGGTLVWSGTFSDGESARIPLEAMVVGQRGRLSLASVERLSAIVANVLLENFDSPIKTTQLELQCQRGDDQSKETLVQKQSRFLSQKIAFHLAEFLADDRGLDIIAFPQECAQDDDPSVVGLDIVTSSDGDVVIVAPNLKDAATNIVMLPLRFDLGSPLFDGEFERAWAHLQEALDDIGVFYGTLLAAVYLEDVEQTESLSFLIWSDKGLEDKLVRLNVGRHAMDNGLLDLARMVILEVDIVERWVDSQLEADLRFERARYFFLGDDYLGALNEYKYLLRWPETQPEAFVRAATAAYLQEDLAQAILIGNAGLNRAERLSDQVWPLTEVLIKAYSDRIWERYRKGDFANVDSDLPKLISLLEEAVQQADEVARTQAQSLNRQVLKRIQAMSKDRALLTKNTVLIDSLREALSRALNIAAPEVKALENARALYGKAAGDPSQRDNLELAAEFFREAIADENARPRRKRPTLEFELAETLYLQEDFDAAFAAAERGLRYLRSDSAQHDYASESWEVLVHLYRALADGAQADHEKIVSDYKAAIAQYDRVPFIVRYTTRENLVWDFEVMSLYACSVFTSNNRPLALELLSILYDNFGLTGIRDDGAIACPV